MSRAQDATVSLGLTRAEKEITGDFSPVSKCRFGRYFYLLSVATSVSVAQEDRSSARFDRTFSEWKLRLNSGGYLSSVRKFPRHCSEKSARHLRWGSIFWRA